MEEEQPASPSTSRSQYLEKQSQRALSEVTNRQIGRPIPDMSAVDESQKHDDMDQDKENRETWAPKKRKIMRSVPDMTIEDKKPRVLFKEDKTKKEPDQDNEAAPTRLETLRQQFKLKLFIPQTEKKDRAEEYIEEEEDRKPSLDNEATEKYIDEMLKSSDDDSEDQKINICHLDQGKTEDDSPNEKLRLETVEKLLNMKEHAHMWLGMNAEEEVPNYWAKRSRITLWKTTQGLPVTTQEMEQCYKNYGHLVVSVAEKFTREELKGVEVKTTRNIEVQNNTSENSCSRCQLVHSLGKKECLSLNNTPPGEWSEAEQWLHKWKKTARAAVIGFESLVCLPEDTKGEILNLSYPCKPDYEVKKNLEEMTEEWVKKQELYKILKTRLMLLNRDSSIPLMVEFVFSRRSEGCGERKDHATSFLKIVQRIQEEYSGPVVVVNGPTVFVPGSTREDYNEAKLRSFIMSKALNLIGKALGVATAKLWINTIPTREGEIRDKTMMTGTLFGPRGTVTEEYCRRLTYKLRKLSTAFKEIQVAGDRRRRSLPKMDREEFEKKFRQPVLD